MDPGFAQLSALATALDPGFAQLSALATALDPGFAELSTLATALAALASPTSAPLPGARSAQYGARSACSRPAGMRAASAASTATIASASVSFRCAIATSRSVGRPNSWLRA